MKKKKQVYLILGKKSRRILEIFIQGDSLGVERRVVFLHITIY